MKRDDAYDLLVSVLTIALKLGVLALEAWVVVRVVSCSLAR